MFATGGQLLLGVAVILGAGFALWRVLVLDKQVKITEQGQITERFTRAIEHLGDEHRRTAVRLGGIYALERIARDSPRDHPQVLEVLCAFVREETRSAPGEAAEERTEEAGQESEAKTATGLERTSTVVQAALEVIGRNALSPGTEGFQPVNLEGARLSKAKLHGVDLSGAYLNDATLTGATLQGDFSDARLNNASLCGATLQGNFSGARFYRAKFAGAVLSEVDFSRAFFIKSDLSQAIILSSDFARAKFNKADLSGAMFEDSDLSDARYLTREQVESAAIDELTKLPKRLGKKSED